jgi:uncharacterized membrane protein
MSGMIRGFIAIIAAPAILLVATQAQAELTSCNRTSFRIEAAIAIEKRANVFNAAGCRRAAPARQASDGRTARRIVVGFFREVDAPSTKGWYRVEAGQCVRPDVRGDPNRLYSYAEAVEADGRLLKRGDVPLAWGGSVALCTRDGRFELADHKDCATRGLNSAGFAVIDPAGRPSTTVRFKEP